MSCFGHMREAASLDPRDRNLFEPEGWGTLWQDIEYPECFMLITSKCVDCFYEGNDFKFFMKSGWIVCPKCKRRHKP
jgi:hypothetical protein